MTGISQASSGEAATLFLRLEGPMQSWGGRTIGRYRRTETVPTKSGVVGLLGAALGLQRSALSHRLDELNSLFMAVRADRAGHIETDYQTIGAGIGVLTAEGQVKRTAGTREFEAIISPHEFVIDASFLVILRGNRCLIDELASALRNPKWPLFLGRKRCTPGTSVFAGVDHHKTLGGALGGDGPEDLSLVEPDSSALVRIVCDLMEADAFAGLVGAGRDDVERLYLGAKSYANDRLSHLNPPVHTGRTVLEFEIPRPTSSLKRPRFSDSLFGLNGPVPRQWGADPDAKKAARAKSAGRGSGGRCIFCRFQPASPQDLHAHHLTYIRRGREQVTSDCISVDHDDFVMLCSECHSAVTMLEYERGFGLHRIDPREPRWQRRILAARESRRQQRNPHRPSVGFSFAQCERGSSLPGALLESTIPLQAGSAFAPDAPGNRWLANRQHVHQRLSMAFPPAGGRFAAKGYGVTREEGGFLYRVVPGPVVRILVRSRLFPDWGRAFADVGWLVRRHVPAPQPFDPSAFREGTELIFDLEANPTKRLYADGSEGRKGSRVPLRSNDALAQWTARRAEKAGFAVIANTLAIERFGQHTARMLDSPSRHWDAVVFSGRLRVTDHAAFSTALTNGIGPAKAFGFGLLSVAPVGSTGSAGVR